MKLLVINSALFLCICGAVLSEAQNAKVDPDDVNLIVDRVKHAGFETRPLSPKADRQMPGSDYNALVDDSFRRAGMFGDAQRTSCPRDQDTAVSNRPC